MTKANCNGRLVQTAIAAINALLLALPQRDLQG
jgi:hypothetical protein